MEAFKRALAKDPTLLPAKINLAIAHLYVPDIPAARQAAEEALKAAPEAPPPNYLLALIARSEGRAENALPYIRKVLEKDPKDLGANVTLGRLHLATGFGGKGYFTLVGEQSEIEAAVQAALALGGERVCDHEIIAAPHDELEQAAFRRPWTLDPAS